MPTARRAAPPDRQIARDQALAFRLAGHQLTSRRPPAELLDVAAACGVRNTPPGSAPLAFHARLAELPPAAVEAALTEDKTLVEVLSVRASPLVVPAQDVAVFTLGALPTDEASLRVPLANHAAALEGAGISMGEALARASEVAREVLDGALLTRAALSAAMTQRLPDGLSVECRACKSRHVQEMLFRLVGVAGVFVIVRRGKESLYVRTDQWLGPAGASGGAAADPVGARAELLRRYLRCYGPTTSSGFAGWAGIGVADARRSWDALAGQLLPVDLAGRATWLHRDDLEQFDRPPQPTGVRLLPPYDAYLDQRDRATLLPDKAQHRRLWAILGNPGAVLAGGQVVGIWRPRKQGRGLGMTVEPLAPLAEDVRAEIEAEAVRLAPLRGCTTAEVTFADAG